MRKFKRVWVFGCGPAGLFAAHAASTAGAEVAVFSRRRPSDMFGAQYLHAPIPGITTAGDEFEINYELRGSVDGYREKVYGPASTATTSPERLLGTHSAWDIRAAYSRAWTLYRGLVSHTELGPGEVHSLLGQAGRRTLVVSSLPAQILCVNPGHSFPAAQIYAIGDAPEIGQYAPVTVATNTVVCNGEDSPRWYRASNILGWHSVEWPGGKVKPPVKGVATVSKPTGTNCDCLPQILRVGRFGTWTKGVLSHDAYRAVEEALR